MKVSISRECKMTKSTFALLMFFCQICLISHSNGARILGMFPLHGRSHFLMFQGVMRSLANAGHQVDVVSHFPQKKPHPNYNDIINLAGTMPMLVNNFTYEMMLSFTGISMETQVDFAGTMICNLLELPEMQKLVKNPPTDPPYDLVITEFFYSSCYFAFGRHLKVPVVALSSGTIMSHMNEPLGNPLNTAIVSEIAERPISRMNFWQRLKNTLNTLAINVQVKHFSKVQNDIVKKHFGSHMPDVEQLEQELSLLLVNSHHIFHGVRPITPAIVEVSGVHVHDDDTPISPDVKKWLDESEAGFVYFTFGSMMKLESFPKSDLLQIFEGLKKISPVRVLLKVANPKELPPGLPENVLTLPWAPQVKILKHKNIRGFVTHGGLMGLQEAVTFGVPLIGIPLLGDQMGNIDVCVQRGMAVSLDYRDLRAPKITEAINSVVHNPKYKNNARIISQQFLDRPKNASETTVFWIEYILRHGGEGLRSPAINLTWWQLALLDVYATIISVTLLILYLVKETVSFLLRRIVCAIGKSPDSKKKD